MSEDKPKYKKMGGSRPGAGRKKRRHQCTVHLDIDIWEEIKDLEKKNDFINDCIRDKLDHGKDPQLLHSGD